MLLKSKLFPNDKLVVNSGVKRQQNKTYYLHTSDIQIHIEKLKKECLKTES